MPGAFVAAFRGGSLAEALCCVCGARADAVPPMLEAAIRFVFFAEPWHHVQRHEPTQQTPDSLCTCIGHVALVAVVVQAWVPACSRTLVIVLCSLTLHPRSHVVFVLHGPLVQRLLDLL